MTGRWEYGSQFDWPRFSEPGQRGTPPWTSGHARLACGRDALQLLVEQVEVKRLWLPSYLCQELIAPLMTARVDLRCYSDSPVERSLDLRDLPLRPDDAVLVVNYFGLRTRDDVCPSDIPNVTMIEDHTHGPCEAWAQCSKADYCFASLRKSIPVPDGAVLWSPRGHALPSPKPTDARRRKAIQDRLTGMLAKSLYLEGFEVPKPVFRTILDTGEECFARGPASSISELSKLMLDVFPFETWRATRRKNFARLAEGLGKASAFEVLVPDEVSCAPFTVACVFPDEASCASAHESLIKQDVYPARLWPLDEPLLDGVPEEHVSLARRMFALPCDGRYGLEDVDRVVDIFIRLGIA